jgi:transcriptional regulator with XRE-family HTH domain
MSSEIIKRLTMIRQTLGLKQGVFAQAMGIPQTTFSTIENGKSPLQERYIKLICLTFNVNETWFRTGEGDMFTEEIPGLQEFVDTFQKLSPEMRKVIREIAHTLLDAQEARETTPAPE